MKQCDLFISRMFHWLTHSTTGTHPHTWGWVILIYRRSHLEEVACLWRKNLIIVEKESDIFYLLTVERCIVSWNLQWYSVCFQVDDCADSQGYKSTLTTVSTTQSVPLQKKRFFPSLSSSRDCSIAVSGIVGIPWYSNRRTGGGLMR